MKILVIGGGISDERQVSLRSAKAVWQALHSNHEAELYDWDGSASWLIEHLAAFDVVFPVLHGEGGEDGQIQDILEQAGCQYVGTNAEHSRLCIDKRQTRDLLQASGVRMAEGGMVTLTGYQEHHLFRLPHVLKPNNGGSSIDTFIIDDPLKRDITKIETAFHKHKELLLEEYIAGQEITVPILDDMELPVIEIVPPQGATFDYANKYNGATQELCPPQSVPKFLQDKAIILAKKCHQIMGCRDLSRTDMIVKDNELYVLEVNTMPGMTEQSLFPRAAAEVGMDMAALTDYLVQLANKRRT